MKKTVRHLFETNSSSVHTLTYLNRKLSKSVLPINQETGKVVGHYGRFDDWGIFNTQAEKLSYLLTCIWYTTSSGYDIKNDWVFRDLEKMLMEYVPCKGLEVVEDIDPYIDHQSVPYHSGECELFYLTQDNMRNFIFNDDVALQCSRD